MTATSDTRYATSADGTQIAYDVTGPQEPTSPALVVVEGALCQRSMGTGQALTSLLSRHYAVHAYDRRGRGQSGPGASAYAVEREVEDLAAVLEAAGPDTFVVGASSGAVLALEAARNGVPMRKLALYESPFIVDDTHAPNDPLLGQRARELVDAGRRGDAIVLFMRTVGVPTVGLAVMRVLPVWKKLTAVAHTLPHDLQIMLPISRAGQYPPATTPT